MASDENRNGIKPPRKSPAITGVFGRNVVASLFVQLRREAVEEDQRRRPNRAHSPS